MPFIYTIADWLSADGIPAVYTSNINVNCNTSVILPASGTFTPIKPRAGYVRIKKNSYYQTNVIAKIGTIQATDGAGNTANVYSGDAAFSAVNQFVDSSFFFWYDWSVQNITCASVVSGAGPTPAASFDYECTGMM